MAFPGSMVGALCCGLVYSICHKLSLTCLAEALGTGILGGLAAYPVAVYIMGITPAGIFVYVVPFLISTIAGSILAFLLITALNKSGVMAMIKRLVKSCLETVHWGHHLVPHTQVSDFPI